MSAFAFDTLKFVRRLTDAGIPQLQAEAQAEVMAEAFVFNMDQLVTRDYLDARLDARFAQQDARLDVRFAEQDARIDGRFAQVDKQLFLHSWVLAVIAATTVIPALTALFQP
ncbi:MAG: hypothetical protein V7696_00405 [Halioglobus sp.]